MVDHPDFQPGLGLLRVGAPETGAVWHTDLASEGDLEGAAIWNGAAADLCQAVKDGARYGPRVSNAASHVQERQLISRFKNKSGTFESEDCS